MANLTHLKVLLLKDLLTLRRNIGFIIAFIVLPIGLMVAFIEIQGLVDNGEQEGSILAQNFKYTTTEYSPIINGVPMPITGVPSDYLPIPMPFDGSVSPIDIDTFSFVGSTLQSCHRKNKGRYYWSKLGIIAADETVRNDAVNFFNDYVFKTQGFPSNFSAEGFEKSQELWDIYKSETNQPFCASLTFNQFDVDNLKFEIEFNLGKQQVPDTNQPAFNDLIKAPDIKSWDTWFDNQAVAFYPYITEFIARKVTQSDVSAPTALFNQEMGYGPMSTVKFTSISPQAAAQLSQNFPFFFMIIMLIPFYYLVSKIASEKESKAREGMKMMGLNDSTYYISWFIVYSLISILTCTILTIMSTWIFNNIDRSLYFIFCLCYQISLFGWAFIIVSFLPTKRSSSIAATLFHIITFYLVYTIADPATPMNVQYGMSILPNVCMAQLIKQIFFYNLNTADGLSWSTLSIEYQNYSFRGGLLMLLFDLVFWGLIGLYLDQVVPSDFGVAKPWNFLCKSKANKMQAHDEEGLLEDDEEQGGENFEGVSDVLKRQEAQNECLKVRGLVKKFGPKTAVNGTNLTMYNGQIFALLGHNGAGKTTTISMLTGLIEPTSGKAKWAGYDMFKDMPEIRKNLGVCPQHDVLFENLNSIEHLRLFCAFKGTPKDEIEGLVEKMIDDIDLTSVKDQQSSTLSGGQKRKLSVAIAMIGNSKIVMLDEPSSGMDTSARRRLWEMMKKYKQGRIVILTTHYMDEADILGDRIAIMAEGKVQCTGSSLFLKNRYGVGYNLVIAKKDRKPAPQVDKFITSRIDNAKKMQEVSSEIAYQLPTSSSKQFKQFFNEFDQNLDNLGIRSYGVGITTLEEVFLKIGHGEEEEQARFEKQEAQANQGRLNNDSLTSDANIIDNYTLDDAAMGKTAFLMHTSAIMKKKILMQIRDRKTLGIDTIFPILLIIVGLALATISFFKKGAPRDMTPFLYPSPMKLYYNQNSSAITSADSSGVIQTFMNDQWVAMNASSVDLEGNIPIDTDQSILEQAGQLDNFTFDLVKNGHAPMYGQFFVNKLNSASSPGYSGVLLLNATSQTIPGAWGAYAHEAFLRDYLSNNGITNFNSMELKIIDQPLPISKDLESLNKTISGTNSAILMTIAWMMISDSLLQNIIKERQKNIKHQILVSGSGLLAYWIGNYIADILFQALPAMSALIFVNVFGIDVPDVGYLFMATMLSNPVFIYFFSFFFDKDESGSLALKMVYFSIGIIGPIAVSVLQVVNKTTQDVALVMRWFFYPFPIYSVTFGYMSIAQRGIIAAVKQATGEGTGELAPLSYDVAGLALIFLLGCIPVYWVLIYMFEMKLIDTLLCKKGSKVVQTADKDRQSIFNAHQATDIDEDITEEQVRIKNTEAQLIPVRISNISKNFGAVKAVRNVSFGLDYGECFALLGVSGAGKSTIFKCLTGEVYPSSGMLTIGGHDVSTAFGFANARKLIGYCPQFDAIFEGLTVREHLETYASLKGIMSDVRGMMIKKAIIDMDLTDYEHIRANNLSGGNKRKLSVAIALLGNPPLVFLDEPSTGVDPQAKRFMWNIVSKISTLRKKSAVIITTHSMEEAEALCTKMGIMVNGQFKCFGSSQHIKDKYGTGYELEMKIKSLSESETAPAIQKYGAYLDEYKCKQILQESGNHDLVDELKQDGVGSDFYDRLQGGHQIETGEFIRWQFAEGQGNRAIDHLEKMFNTLQVIEHFGTSWRIKVSRDNYSIGFLFGMMEDIQKQFDISEYSVTQTTLEQIFNNFALEAEQEEGRERRSTFKRRSTKKKTLE